MKKKISILSLFFLILFLILPFSSLAQDKETEKKYVPGELIVEFKENKIPKDEQSNGLKIEPIFKNHANDELGKFFKVKLPLDANLTKAQADFEKLGEIKKVSLNYLAQAAYTPNDPKYNDGSQWGMTKINMSSAWDITQGSSDVVIANIDSGVDTDHEEINGKIWVNTADPINGLDDDANGLIDDNIGWDYVANAGYGTWGSPCVNRDPADLNRTADNDPNPEPSGLNEDACVEGTIDTGVNHGTYTAGIAAANTNNAFGIAGVCPQCKIMALRVLDDEGWGTYTDIAAAITYAGDKGAEVISMSLAGPYDDTVIAAAVHHAYEAGSVLVAAAGNGDQYGVGYDIDPPANKLSPICNDNYDYLDGGDNQVIGVAATNPSDIKTGFSNYGKKYVDISAPGETSIALPILTCMLQAAVLLLRPPLSPGSLGF
jgi:thermitase